LAPPREAATSAADLGRRLAVARGVQPRHLSPPVVRPRTPTHLPVSRGATTLGNAPRRAANPGRQDGGGG
jgi:hypothetical protein